MTIHTWNTKRLYTRQGQRISAETVKDKEGKTKIVFADLDRMVDGEFYVLKEPDGQYAMEQMVMHHYDYGDYAHYPQDKDYVVYRRKVQELNQYSREHAPKLKEQV